jgi:glycosyltransferase involved in cell wall biosynthesis
MVHLAIVMMLKNEERRLHVTLASIASVAQSLIVLDTGSTDNTLTLLHEFVDTHPSIQFHLLQRPFKDFATSRNELLDFVDTFPDVDFMLMMDCNDELRGGDALRAFAEMQMTTTTQGWMMCQEWFTGDTIKYHNARFLRARCGWRYKGVVHEYLYSTEDAALRIQERVPAGISLFQDRVLDDDKSSKRFVRDYDLLMDAHKADPSNTRTMFYMAQTCACLGKDDEAYRFYCLRAAVEEGFAEERFEALTRCGEYVHRHIGEQPEYTWDVALALFMKAVTVFPRIEPLLEMAKYYQKRGDMAAAYLFLHGACVSDIPENSLLFVNKRQYEYERWHLMGIVAYYCKQYIEGYGACQKAIAHSNLAVDKHNLQFYTQAIASMQRPPST